MNVPPKVRNQVKTLIWFLGTIGSQVKTVQSLIPGNDVPTTRLNSDNITSVQHRLGINGTSSNDTCFDQTIVSPPV